MAALVAFAAALLAFRLAGLLARRYRSSRRPELLAWAAGLGAYAVAAAAIAWGEAAGWDDRAPLMAESFIQWVVEEKFVAGRPAWETVGVEMTGDVQPYEEAKIRILNATHSAIAWAGTLRGDYYWQDYSWARVFNANPYDRLRGYTNVNLTLIFANQNGWQVMLYDKNVLNTTAITGDFLNTDDTGLTTNVFLTDPRLIGIRVTKNW